MADRNQRTVASITRKGCGPQVHAYNDPSLSATEFLRAVYCDPTLPMSIRIDAARGLLPYTEPRPARAPLSYVGCKIIIGGLGPCAPDPLPGSTENHSQNPLSPNKGPSHNLDDQGSPNFEENPEPSPLMDYLQSRQGSDHSTPPTPAELQEIKAAINRLRPDLAHLPVPEPHLCACGHWTFGPCPLGERCCDRTKLN